MRDAINESRLIAATLTLKEYFGNMIWHVYPVLKECDETKKYFLLGTLSAFATFYLGQVICVEDQDTLVDDVYFLFEAYKTLLTIDKEPDEIEMITAAIDKCGEREIQCMLSFYRKDILVW